MLAFNSSLSAIDEPNDYRFREVDSESNLSAFPEDEGLLRRLNISALAVSPSIAKPTARYFGT